MTKTKTIIRIGTLAAFITFLFIMDKVFQISTFCSSLHIISLRENAFKNITVKLPRGTSKMEHISKHRGVLNLTPEVSRFAENVEKKHGGVLNLVPEVFRFAEAAEKKISYKDNNVPSHVAAFLAGGLTRQQYNIFIDLLYTFDKVTKDANVTYFLFYGSLLGSYRCHCLLQWDDDLDLMSHVSNRPTLLGALGSLAPTYTAVDHKDGLIKFYKTKNSTVIPGGYWRWPFIDVTFYSDDGVNIKDTNYWWKHKIISRSDVFPLQHRPFEGLLVLAPRNPEALFKRYGNVEVCATQSYSHRRERMDRQVTEVKCDELKGIHPHVERVKVNNARYEEILKIGKKEISRTLLTDN